MDIVSIVLRILHIFSGMFWAGSAWILAFFLGPTSAALGADGGKFMNYLIGKMRFSIYVTIAAVVTVLAGLVLFFLHYGIPGLSTPTGATFGLGGIFGLISLGIGGAVTGPTAMKMTRLGGEIAAAGKPPTPAQMAEMGALQKRLASGALWNAIFVSIALVLMASARYV